MPRISRAWSLGPSPIHGIGVFATRDFAAGARLGRIHAEPLTAVQRFTTLPTTAVLTMRDGEPIVHAVLAGFPFWYLNYSRNSNVRVSGTSTLLASRPILEGDEFTMPFTTVAGTDLMP